MYVYCVCVEGVSQCSTQLTLFSSTSQNLSDQLKGGWTHEKDKLFFKTHILLLNTTFIKKRPLVCSALISNTTLLNTLLHNAR